MLVKLREENLWDCLLQRQLAIQVSSSCHLTELNFRASALTWMFAFSWSSLDGYGGASAAFSQPSQAFTLLPGKQSALFCIPVLSHVLTGKRLVLYVGWYFPVGCCLTPSCNNLGSA